jgi:GR25 family glycosyltransferase involved in LPS biosynthesis
MRFNATSGIQLDMTHQQPGVPVFIIFLEQHPRCDALCAALAQWEIPFEMIAARNVRDYDRTELAAIYDEPRAVRRVGRPMGRGEIGCALSHCDVYRRILDRSIQLALVLEEDAVPGPQFKSFWLASAALPRHVELLLLYSEEGFIRHHGSGSLAGFTFHEATVMLSNTVGYYIRRDCAEQLMWCNTPVSMVADWPLNLSSMRQFLIVPMLIGHCATGSTIATERPRGNILRRYRAPSWFSGLFHLSGLGYLLQPQRYEGWASYHRREVSRRLKMIWSPMEIHVRRLERPAFVAGAESLRGRFLNRIRRLSYSAQDVVTGRRSLRRRGGAAPVNSAPRVLEARLKIGCYANWPDFDDALRFLTPGGTGVWNDVAFVPAGSMQTDWLGIFNQPRRRAVDFFGSANRVFFAIGEPPTRMHRPLHLGQGRGTTVFTCEREVAALQGESRNYVLTPPMLRTWSVRRSFEQLSTVSLRDKPRRLSWITSNVSSLPGHRRRLEFLARLRKNLEFDLYGRGFHRVYDKWDVLAPYRYSIAFENAREPWYFTEKLMDCYVCETMPIYIGDPTIANFFPAASLEVIDPDAPDAIEQIRSIIHSDAWSRNREAILEAKRLVLHEYNVFAMLSRLIAARTEPASAPVRMRFAPVQLAREMP